MMMELLIIRENVMLSERSVIDMLWTMLEEKETGKWELILDDPENEHIIQTGYISSDADVMIKFLGYLNQGVKSDIPDRIIKDLDFIKKSKEEGV